MCEQEGEWSNLYDMSPLGRQAALDLHGLVLLPDLIRGISVERERERKAPAVWSQSSSSKGHWAPLGQGGKQIWPLQMLQLLDAAQTEPGAPATLAAVIAGGVFHSVHNVELMRERERGAFRHVLLLSLRGLVASGSSGTQVCSEHSMWQSSWALEAVLEGICSSALFSPQRFLMVVLDAPTGKDCLSQVLAALYCSLGHNHSSPLGQYQWSCTSLFNVVAEHS